MNDVIETILSHRSIRKFKDTSLTSEQIDTIVHSAQAASTSSFVQAYSIIGITEQDRKEKLAELSGNQKYVASNGHFFVFCADLHRHDIIAKKNDEDITEALESTEMFMVSVIDASLAAQNAALAAESLGLGICYIGGLRNNLYKVSELLQTPKHVVPLFGLVVGYPSHEPEKKPRLPKSLIYHEEKYTVNTKKIEYYVEQYDKTIKEYYASRSKNSRIDKWSMLMMQKMINPSRLYVKQYLKDRGFPLK